MSSGGKYYRKRQKTNDEPTVVHAVGDSFSDELNDMKSALNELLAHSRLQTANMASMERNMDTMADALNHLKVRNSQLETTLQQTQKSSHVTRVFLQEANVDMKRRLDILGNRQTYQEALIKNQKWTYSALAPYQAYWDSIEEEEHIEAASEFLEQIERNTREMRHGEARDGSKDGRISICAELPFNAMFLPHWEEFASALEQYQHALKCWPEQKKSSFQLCDVELTLTVLGILSKALQSAHFHSFALGSNSFGRAGIQFALKYLRNNDILEDFCIADNPITHADDIDELCEIIEDHPSIEMIRLGGCIRTEVDGYGVLKSVMTAGASKLKTVAMIANDITTGGSTFISNFLATNPILETLKLRENNLKDQDAFSIARALKHNTNLRFLDVENNDLTYVGWDALRKAEFDSTSLNSAADSNHTCFIYNSSFINININIDRGSEKPVLPLTVRRRKIYSVLSARNRECSNIQYFDKVPFEFLPDMLRSIQLYSERPVGRDGCDNTAVPLSVVFEVMQSWSQALFACGSSSSC